MTDEQIIKALECCVNWNCKECPFHVDKGNCTRIFDGELLNLINRLKTEKEALISGQETLQKHIADKNAEIERLQTEKDNLIRIYKECMTEAIKEFAEKLKEMPSVTNCEYEWVHTDIDNLVKELTEGINGE